MSNKTKVRKLELKRKPYGFGNWYIILDKGYSGRWNIDHNPEQQRIIHQDLRSFLKDTAIKKWTKNARKMLSKNSLKFFEADKYFC